MTSTFSRDPESYVKSRHGLEVLYDMIDVSHTKRYLRLENVLRYRMLESTTLLAHV